VIAAFARKLDGARGVAYAAEVAPGLYRGGAPDEEGVTWLRAQGVRTVINLRHYHGVREEALVAGAGLGYVRVRIASSDAPSLARVRQVLEHILDPALRPTYVHCKHGVDRTGLMMAVYRMEIDGWSNADAFAEMEHFGAHKMWRDLRKFVRTYAPIGLWRR